MYIIPFHKNFFHIACTFIVYFTMFFFSFLPVACLLLFYGCRCSLLVCHFRNTKTQNCKNEQEKKNTYTHTPPPTLKNFPSHFCFQPFTACKMLLVCVIGRIMYSIFFLLVCLFIRLYHVFIILIFKYLLSRDNLNASAVLITSTYACSSNRRDVIFKL